MKKYYIETLVLHEVIVRDGDEFTIYRGKRGDWEFKTSVGGTSWVEVINPTIIVELDKALAENQTPRGLRD